uniref:Uncharacterized protein n=1 Tax=Octopus bimaculoides TaxID=37653 RepID=A0A0L8HZW1_OCTBM
MTQNPFSRKKVTLYKYTYQKQLLKIQTRSTYHTDLSTRKRSDRRISPPKKLRFVSNRYGPFKVMLLGDENLPRS